MRAGGGRGRRAKTETRIHSDPETLREQVDVRPASQPDNSFGEN